MQESRDDKNHSRLSGAEAKSSLDRIERSRHAVIDEIDVPGWYWGALALAWVGLGVVTDQGVAWLTLAATLVFGAVHAAVSHRVNGGRHRSSQLSVRQDVAGRATPALIGAGLIALVGVTIVGSLLAAADGATHPVTSASVVVGVAIVLGGPRLMTAVRGRATRSAFPS